MFTPNLIFQLFISLVHALSEVSKNFQLYEIDTCLNNKTLSGAFQVHAPSTSFCGCFCLSLRENCLSFFYNSDLKTCKVSGQYFINASMVINESGNQFYKRSDFQDGASSCSLESTTSERKSCPPSYKYVSSINYCFKYFNLWMKSANAQQHCNAEGGRLAVLDTNNKFTAVTNFTKTLRYKMMFIDGYYTDTNEWKFSNGELMDTEFFNPHASHYWSYRRCCAIQEEYLYGADCAVKRNFLCEFDV